MFRRIIGLSCVVAAGCAGGYQGEMAESIHVSGRVSFADGRPVKHVEICLQPTTQGYPAAFPLNADGTFSGQLIPGKYAYCFRHLESSSLQQRQQSILALQQIPAEFRSAHLDRQIRVFGEAVDVTLPLDR